MSKPFHKVGLKLLQRNHTALCFPISEHVLTKCAVGQGCNSEADCQSSSCVDGKCAAAACDDKILNGTETERSEIGATALQASGFGRIGARSNQIYNLIFRFNSSDFDRVDITLGFGDAKDGRAITVLVPLETFKDVGLDLTPASLRWSKLPL